MDASIILQGQPVNALAAISAGNQAGFDAYGMRRQQGMDRLMQTQGAGILAGDQNALNALAGYDPAAALGIQGQQQSMAMQRERMAMDREQFEMQKQAAKEATAAKLAEQAAQIDAAELAASRDQMAKGLAGASFFYQQGDRAGYEGFLRAQGLDPAQFPFEAFPAYAAQYEGVIEAMEAFAPPDPTKGAPTGYMFTDPRNPAAGVTQLPGYERTPGVVVNTGDTGEPMPQIGSVPQGFAAVPDPSSPAGFRMERIPGGPEDRTASDAAAAEGAAQQSNIVLGKIGQIRGLLDQSSVFNPVTGFGAQTAAGYGGTNAANARALIDTIEANMAFDALAAMREASPTGGALGAISQRELELLGSTLSSLSQAQSPDQFRASLDQLEAIYVQIMRKAAAYPNAAQFGFGGGGAPAAPAASPTAPAAPPQRLRYNPATGELE